MKDMLKLCCRYFCFRVSLDHDDGKLSPLIVVGSQLFVDCSLPWLKSDYCGALHSVLSFCDSIHRIVWTPDPSGHVSVKYFVRLVFAVLLHPWIPWKFPHYEINCIWLKCTAVSVHTSVSRRPVRWILIVFTAWKMSTTCSVFTLSSTVYRVQNAPVRPSPSLVEGRAVQRRGREGEGEGRGGEGGGISGCC